MHTVVTTMGALMQWKEIEVSGTNINAWKHGLYGKNDQTGYWAIAYYLGLILHLRTFCPDMNNNVVKVFNMYCDPVDHWVYANMNESSERFTKQWKAFFLIFGEDVEWCWPILKVSETNKLTCTHTFHSNCHVWKWVELHHFLLLSLSA